MSTNPRPLSYEEWVAYNEEELYTDSMEEFGYINEAYYQATYDRYRVNFSNE